MSDAPQLGDFMRHLAETPTAFLGEPRISHRGVVHVDAVVFDAISDLDAPPAIEGLARFRSAMVGDRNRLRMVLIAAWLLRHPWFRGKGFGVALTKWLSSGLDELATLIAADLFVTDEERREELVRRVLAAVGVQLAGESKQEAADRLATVDSVTRVHVMRQTQAKRQRAEELRKKMAEERAREAAARYGRE